MSGDATTSPPPVTSNGSDHQDATNDEASSISEKSESASVKQLDGSTNLDNVVKTSNITKEEQHETEVSIEKPPETAAHESPNHDSQTEAGVGSQASTPALASLSGTPVHETAEPSVEEKDSVPVVPVDPPHLPVSAPAGSASLRGPPPTPVLYQALSSDKLFAEYDALSARIAKVAEPDAATEREVVTTALNLLVGGLFDKDNFIAVDEKHVSEFVAFVFTCPEKLQVELWTIWAGAARRSARNAQLSCEAGLTERILDAFPLLHAEQDPLADQFTELLVTLTRYTVSVQQLRRLFALLQPDNGAWPRSSLRVLHVLRQMQQRHGPDAFFALSGRPGSYIQLPPLSKWLQQSWTFHCWFCLDSLPTPSRSRLVTPYLFSFKTSKGVGYTGSLIGSNLVISSIRVKGKPMQHCVKFEFSPGRWHMVSIVFVYARWGTNEVLAYVDGQLVSASDMSWLVSPAEPFDKCTIGVNSELETDTYFNGQLGAVYVFTEALHPMQIFAMLTLGPNYQSQFRNPSEVSGWGSLTEVHYQLATPAIPQQQPPPSATPADVNSPQQQQQQQQQQQLQQKAQQQPGALSPAAFDASVQSSRRALFDGHLSNAILLLYTPRAVDHQLCLNQLPKGSVQNMQYFAHSPHAMMMPGAKAVETQSLLATLHALGGVQMLYPLFNQLYTAEHHPTSHFCTILLSLICDFLERSSLIQQQVFQSRALQVLSYHMEKMPTACLNNSVLDCVIRMTRILVQQSDLSLLKQLYDHLLFNPTLWLRASPEVQVRLYAFLASDLVSRSRVYNNVRRTASILLSLHSLKYYYYVVPPSASAPAPSSLSDSTGAGPPSLARASLQPQRTPGDSSTPSKLPDGTIRPDENQVVQIRSCILAHLRQLVLCSGRMAPEEIESILNYLTTVREEANLTDVMQWLVVAVYEQPASLVPGLDARLGLGCILSLVGHPSEAVRILALKVIGFYLMRSTEKRKTESVNQHNLFSLIGDRLLQHADAISLNVYNVLFEVLTEQLNLHIVTEAHPEPEAHFFIANPMLLKPMASSIARSHITPETIAVLQLFLRDLSCMCQNDKINRRTLLQQSVWQDWLFGLAFLSAAPPPADADRHAHQLYTAQVTLTASVFALFRTLLAHAIRYEFGGWRVWIDTLAILHSKLCAEEAKQYAERVFRSSKRATTTPAEPAASAGSDTAAAVKGAADAAATSTDQKAKPSQQQQQPHSFKQGVTQPRPYQITEFKWSPFHLRLLNDVLACMENDVVVWKTHPNRSIMDLVNDSENSTYCQNAVHFISQLCDGLISSCGGMLPLLAASTSPKGEVDVLEIGHGLSIELAAHYLQRLAAIADIFVFSSNAPLAELENEKNMARGGVLRQVLRVVFMCGIRNTLESRYRQFTSYEPQSKIIFPGSQQPLALGTTLSRQQSRNSTSAASPKSSTSGVPGAEPSTSLHGSDEHAGELHSSSDEQQHAAGAGVASAGGRFKRLSGSTSGSVPNAQFTIDPLDSFICGAYLINLSSSDSLTESISQREVEQLFEQQQKQMTQQLLLTVRDPELLLQEVDLSRLRAAVYRDLDDSKQVQFLALAVVYYLSVLIVSRYRDVLEHPPLSPLRLGPLSLNSSVSLASPSPGAVTSPVERSRTLSVASGTATPNEPASPLPDGERALALASQPSVKQSTSPPFAGMARRLEQPASAETTGAPAGEFTDIGVTSGLDNGDGDGRGASLEEVSLDEPDAHKRASAPAGPISTIGSSQPAVSSSLEVHGEPGAEAHHLPPTLQQTAADAPAKDSSLSARLERALGNVIPLLREIFVDFAAFLSKTLVGSKGQELMSSGLATIRQSSSAVEVAMLLCSQEWQNSLQRNAGLAFIELVNEGRLLAHATRDHLVRVANEAEFILKRMRADDVQKHMLFDSGSGAKASERAHESLTCHQLINAAKRRDRYVARKLTEKICTILSIGDESEDARPARSPADREHSPSSNKREFWLLDTWEDDSRRRRRFVPNPYGSAHVDAAYHTLVGQRAAPVTQEDAIDVGSTAKAAAAALGVRQQAPSALVQQDLAVSDEELERAASEKDVAEQVETALHLATAGPVQYSTSCKLIALGLTINGTLSVTRSDLYFELADADAENAKLDQSVLKYVDAAHGRWALAEIRAIFSRTFLLQNVALEIFLANRTSVLFAFADLALVKNVVESLPRVGIGFKYGVPQSRKASLAAPRQLFRMSEMTSRWQRREISNFDYLMYLNSLAGRTYNDLNQYPIFPWVITNYEGAELDLNDPANFRDLSLPIGALNPERRSFFEERYSNWEDPNIPAFHYGTHMSNSGYTLNFLCRVEPLTSVFLSMQGGKFDHPNRIFSSVAQSWKNCQQDTSDVKELIPEFYYLAEMFSNANGLPLGAMDDGKVVNDVELPPWAHGSAESFVRQMRQALESDLVSCQLHHWIDLVFGYKQRGPEAVRALNVFYYLSYEGSVNLAAVSDPVMREALENQIRHFGQMPAQLLTDPHPPRSSVMSVSPLLFSGRTATDDVCMLLKYPSNSPIVYISANTHPLLQQSAAVITVSANHTFAVNRWSSQNANIPLSNLTMAAGPAQLPQGTARFAQQQQQAQQQASNAPGWQQAGVAGGAQSPPAQQSQQVPRQLLQNLPLQMDPAIAAAATTLQLAKRQLGENFDQRLNFTHNHFVSTADNKNVLACGFWDNSFRAFSTDSGRVSQIIYGHAGLVTCICRSECNASQDCYVVTGSNDRTLMLWLWSARAQAIVNDSSAPPPAPAAATAVATAPPTATAAVKANLIGTTAATTVQVAFNDINTLIAPRAILYGHRHPVTTATVSAELGLVVSGAADGVLLMHTLSGELMRSLKWPAAPDVSLASSLVLKSSSPIKPPKTPPTTTPTGPAGEQPGDASAATATGGASASLPHPKTGSGSPTTSGVFIPPAVNPGIIVLNREGIVLVKYDRDLVALFSLSGRLLRFSRHRDLIHCMTMSRDGQYVVLGTDGGRTELWRVHELEPVHAFPMCDAPIRSLCFTHDNKNVLAGVGSGCVLVFNVELSRFNLEYVPALEQQQRALRSSRHASAAASAVAGPPAAQVPSSASSSSASALPASTSAPPPAPPSNN